MHLAMMELSFLLFAIMSHGMITISLHMFSKTSGKTNFDILSADISKESEKKKKEREEKKKKSSKKKLPNKYKVESEVLFEKYNVTVNMNIFSRIYVLFLQL